jgi:hypothetical protein
MYVPEFVPPPPTYTGPNGTAIPYQKSGGLVVGINGQYPYDSGAWLLASNNGFARQSGAFTMVFPDEPGADGSQPAPGPRARGFQLFHRKQSCR